MLRNINPIDLMRLPLLQESSHQVGAVSPDHHRVDRPLAKLVYVRDVVGARLRPGGYVVVNDWKLHGWQGGAAADGVQARFEAIAARLGWEQKMLKRTPSSLYFCYKKPLARRELGPLLPPLK